jgi:hypothetical protein
MRIRAAIGIVVLSLIFVAGAGAQTVESQQVKRYQIQGGVMREVVPDSVASAVDSLLSPIDSIARDTLSRREIRRMERDTVPRYSAIFRDTVPISRMTALSFVAPGFGQLHNRQAWKIPLVWGTIGTAVYYGIQENRNFQKAKTHYDLLVHYGYGLKDSDMAETQRVMLKYNTRRQIFFGAATAAYIYFISDGVMNYPGGSTNVKIATTLSTILPGAGQIYNKSYWKAPIVFGSFATMVMMIDWNNRGYQRFKLAYNQKAAGLDVEPALASRPESEILSYRKAYRRNRDLCIILGGLVYLLNVVDAHVDSHMQTFDVKDDLDVEVTPMFTNVTTLGNGPGTAMGLTMSMRF